MIFPGGFLPSLEAILSYAGRAGGLRMVYLDDIGRHYAETLKRWRENLIAHQGAFDDLGLGTRFERMWFLYLQYCEAAFLEAHVSDVQVVLAKSGYRAPLEIAAN
jgi:cyclopropane-fatty-acyl-phospholipid synthase